MGVGRGDRVGVRIRSGTVDLYVAIMGVLLAGAAYVPVDADDPDERARLVFGEAASPRWSATTWSSPTAACTAAPASDEDPGPADDAWIIFTSGSTGTPKGVAVSHRSAAAFVDAESRMFLQGEPLGPTDRVMAGLSVAFDASCEEMWLAWAHGGCLVPGAAVAGAQRRRRRAVAGRQRRHRRLDGARRWWRCGRPSRWTRVRLLIMGGEACPPEIGARLAATGPRGLEHLRTDRGDRRRLRRPARRRTARSGSGCRSTAGTSPSSTSTGDARAPRARSAS